MLEMWKIDVYKEVMLEYDYVLTCVFLEWMHVCSYMTIWVSYSYIDDVVV